MQRGVIYITVVNIEKENRKAMSEHWGGVPIGNNKDQRSQVYKQMERELIVTQAEAYFNAVYGWDLECTACRYGGVKRF